MSARLPIARTAVASRGPSRSHGVNLGYRVRNQLVWLGELLVFVLQRGPGDPDGAAPLPHEVWRLIAEVTFGGGILAIAASTILVSALLASVVGVQLGIEGLQGLNIIGLAPLDRPAVGFRQHPGALAPAGRIRARRSDGLPVHRSARRHEGERGDRRPRGHVGASRFPI